MPLRFFASRSMQSALCGVNRSGLDLRQRRCVRHAPRCGNPIRDATMQFRIQVTEPRVDIDAVEQALVDADPAALVDFDLSGQALRVSTVLAEAELLAAVNQAGLAAELPQIERVPSNCCGGCGG
jgi:hypothetical protein